MHDRLLTRLRSDSVWLLALCAAAGTALVLARELKFGVALHADSVLYISVARSLLAGEGFLQFVEGWGPMVIWPPLYPLLLTAPGLFGLDPLDAAGPLNAAVFGLCVLVAGLWLRRRLQSRGLAWWGCLAVMLSLPLTSAASWAMSEPLFILLATLSMAQADSFLHNGKRRALAWAAVFAALACLTRYLGVALVAATALLLAAQPGAAVPLKAKRVAAYALVALAPTALWILRNWLLSGQPIGDRISNSVYYDLPEILDGVLSSLILWAYPDSSLQRFSLAVQALTAALWFAVALATGGLMVRAWRSWRPFCTWGLFALVYVALLAFAMMAGSTWGGFQPRFLSPACLPVLLAAAFALDRLLVRGREGRLAGAQGDPSAMRWIAWATTGLGDAAARRLLSVAAAAALLGWLAWSAGWQAVEISRAQAGGIHGSIQTQRSGSEVLQRFRESPEADLVYSNDVYSVYLANETAEIHALIPGWPHNKQAIERLSVPAQIVWFDDWQMAGAFGYNDFDLRFLPGVVVEADLADGALLRTRPGKPFDEAAYNAAKTRHINQVIAAAGERLARTAFDLHLKGRTLAYVKAPCTEADTAARFFLHILPDDPGDLPAHSRRRGFENRDFSFRKAGLRFDGKCVVERPLPHYRIAAVRTGQFSRGERTWQVEVAPFEHSSGAPTCAAGCGRMAAPGCWPCARPPAPPYSEGRWNSPSQSRSPPTNCPVQIEATSYSGNERAAMHLCGRLASS